jgi:outer membrane protein
MQPAPNARNERAVAAHWDGTLTMKPRLLALAVPLALGLTTVAELARGEDLLQIYREALRADPAIAAAKANWEAVQEKAPQARAGLLPNVSATGSGSVYNYDATIKSDPRQEISRNFNQYNATVSASQPLFRYQNLMLFDQAKWQVAQADYVLGFVHQDLIVRVAVAYFDVLLAQFNIELAESQKKAVDEQLAQAKRNFEVGVATITDTNEAQAKYDAIVAQEITVRNEYDNRVTALRAIIGRYPKDLKKLGGKLVPTLPEPNVADYWVDRALKENLNVRIAESNFEIAKLEVERARGGHYPTLDLVGSYGAQGSSAAISSTVSSDSRTGIIGLQLNVPIYQGGFTNSRVREAVALLEKSRQELEGTRRAALFQAQTGFAGVNSATASVKAFEQAVVSAESALASNILGQEVGVRTFLDVLQVQQNVYSTRRDLADAYFRYLIGVLRLKASVGALTEQDIEDLNRQLKG